MDVAMAHDRPALRAVDPALGDRAGRIAHARHGERSAA
jgi:hypothetical protein